MTDEVEIDVCCDGLRDALETGAIQVVEAEPGVFVEVIPDETGETGIAINFCPFCGEARPQRIEAGGNGYGELPN